MTSTSNPKVNFWTVSLHQALVELLIFTPGLQGGSDSLHSLSESLAEVGFEPLTIGSMDKNLTTELSWQRLALV